jgi:hypothetical protein
MILASNSHHFPQEKCVFCKRGPEVNIIYINFKLQIGKMKSIITIVKQTVATTQQEKMKDGNIRQFILTNHTNYMRVM